MATDFGDDMGDLMLQWLKEAVERGYRHYSTHNTSEKQWYEEQARNEGRSEEEVQQISDEMSSREEVCIPFGTAEDASYFAQVCRTNGVWAMPYTDRDGGGYVQFAVEDAERIGKTIPSFEDVMAQVHVERIMANTEPLTVYQMEHLREITELPELPGQAEKALVPEQIHNHTQDIADKVNAARNQCRDFDEFKRLLADEGIGVSTTKAGEILFYEARLSDDGTLLPYSHEKRDWAVGADVLKDRYGVDATHDWFTQNREVDGSLDMDGSTPDLNQGIESHDGRDTDTRTLRMEYEATASGDVAPSRAREAQTDSPYNLESCTKETREASRQLEQSSGHDDRLQTLDYSEQQR